MIEFPDDDGHYRNRGDRQYKHEKPYRVFPLEKYDFSCSSYLFFRQTLFSAFIEMIDDDVEEEVEEDESEYGSRYRGRQGGAKRKSFGQTRRRREQRLH